MLKYMALPAGEPGRLLLLYGDNGSGKTTLLQLLWNVLSPSENRGHRTFLARTPFSEFTVRFTHGAELVVKKLTGLIGDFEVVVRRSGMEDCTVPFETDEQLRVVPRSNRISRWLATPSASRHTGAVQQVFGNELWARYSTEFGVDKAEQEYYKFLTESRMAPQFLADDRTFHWDPDELDESHSVASAPSQREGRNDKPSARQLAERELRLRIAGVNDWLRVLALRGQSVGSTGANSIYRDMLRKLATSGSSPAESMSGPEAGGVLEILSELEKRSQRFEEFQLVPHFAAAEFVELLETVPHERLPIAQEILIPYLDSLQARYEALEEAERMVRSLLTLVNEFFVDKKVTFDPGQGLRIITTNDAELPPSSLSSGERQLMMLLCTTILAPRDSRLFIIDEPELSLGVPWQRAILSALLSLTDGTSLQFIVATHSVEIVTAQREQLVQLSRNQEAVDD